MSQQGMPWLVKTKIFGHGGFEVILERYYAQSDDDACLVEIVITLLTLTARTQILSRRRTGSTC